MKGVCVSPRPLRRFDASTGCLVASTYEWKGKSYPNMTLINLTLSVFGPMKERTLTLTLIGYQVLSCAIALYFRLHLAALWYGKL